MEVFLKKMPYALWGKKIISRKFPVEKMSFKHPNYWKKVAENKAKAQIAQAKSYIRKTAAGVKKRVASYEKHPQRLQRDYQKGAAFVRSIQGHGDYTFRNSMSDIRKGQRGFMGGHHKKAHVRLEKGEMRISHTEYIGELISSGVTGATNFVSQSYGINPGNAGTFPWLSNIAINFQDYKFLKLIFEFRPLVSESTSTSAATLTTMGSVIMATQYDSVLGPYTNKNTMENSDYSISFKPSEGRKHAVECDSHFNPLGTLYVSGNIATTSVSSYDIRFQNLGIFQIASSNIPIASNTALDLGSIYVHYEVELYKPQLNGGLTNLLSSHYLCNTGVAAATPLGTPTAASTNYLPLTFPSTSSFAFPLAVTEGSFFCMYYMVNITAATITATVPTATNGTIMTIFNGSGGADDAAQAAWAPFSGPFTEPTAIIAFIVTVNAPGAQLCTVQLPTNWTITGSPQGELFVTPWNTSLTN